MKLDFRKIIDFWPTYVSLAEKLGTSPSNIKQMRMRNRIPAQYWPRLVSAAQEIGYEIDFESLARITEREVFGGE